MSSARTFGEAERHLARLCRELSRRGHDVFVALRPTNQWQHELSFCPEENFMHVSVRNSFGMFSARRITRFVNAHKIDILHAHAAKDYLAASVVCRSAKDTRLVLTRHIDQPLKPFHRFALRNIDAAIGVTPAIRDQLGLVFPADRTFTVVNGIEFDDAFPEKANAAGHEFRAFHGIPSNAPLVVTIGELKVSNGQRDVVLAAGEVVKQFPECRFVIAGHDTAIDQKFRRELKRLVKVLGLETSFIWLDRPVDTAPMLAAADILVSPVHSGEPSAGMLDAMVAGVAIIATSSDNSREVPVNEKATISPKDPLAIAKSVVSYLEDDEARRRAGRQLQAAVREKFSLARMIDETEAIYRRVLGR